MTIRVFALALSAILLPCAASAETLKLDWQVSNNFALLANPATQERFTTETRTFINCLAKTGDLSACSPGQERDGLTQKPYLTRFDAPRFRHRADLVRPTRGVQLGGRESSDRVDVVVTVEGAPDGATCAWTLDGETVGERPCDRLAITTRIDEASKIAVAVDGRPDLRGETTINVRRVVIVGLGDSFMSGEGNPHRRRTADPVRAEAWLEPRCHRSLLAASTLAALRYAEANARTYVAFLNLACSGATIETGLLGRYGGVVSADRLDNQRGPDDRVDYTRTGQLPSQIDQAKAALCVERSGGRRDCLRPDVVLLGIGVNDLRFRTIVETLAQNTCGPRCRDGLGQTLDSGLKRLAGTAAGSLDKAMKRIDDELMPKAALAIGYPDPTRDGEGKPCNASIVSRNFGGFIIDADESTWAHDQVLVRLNATVQAAAANRSGWRYVDGAMSATANNGFCAAIPFFNSAWESNIDSGTMHPNALGHDAVAKLIEPALNDAIPVDVR